MKVDTFVKNLLDIETQLEILNRQFTDPYEANIFPNTDLYRQKLAELSHITTHEIATEIGFNRHRIILIAKYIEFCKQFNEFTDDSFLAIIDQDLSIQEKKDLADQITDGDFALFFEKYKQIRKSWNQIFDNKSYAKVKSIIDV